MKTKTIAKLLALWGPAMCLGAMPGLADGAQCRHVGGGVLSDFLDQTQCTSSVGLCAEGTVSGDIRGEIGIQVLAVTTQNGTTVCHVHHHLVTDAGDMIFFDDADLSTFPTSDPNRVLADYLQGIEIVGGTGHYEGATGTVFPFGAADLKLGQITLRYAGTICFAAVPPP